MECHKVCTPRCLFKIALRKYPNSVDVGHRCLGTAYSSSLFIAFYVVQVIGVSQKSPFGLPEAEICAAFLIHHTEIGEKHISTV